MTVSDDIQRILSKFGELLYDACHIRLRDIKRKSDKIALSSLENFTFNDSEKQKHLNDFVNCISQLNVAFRTLTQSQNAKFLIEHKPNFEKSRKALAVIVAECEVQQSRFKKPKGRPQFDSNLALILYEGIRWAKCIDQPKVRRAAINAIGEWIKPNGIIESRINIKIGPGLYSHLNMPTPDLESGNWERGCYQYLYKIAKNSAAKSSFKKFPKFKESLFSGNGFIECLESHIPLSVQLGSSIFDLLSDNLNDFDVIKLDEFLAKKLVDKNNLNHGRSKTNS